MTSPYPEVVEVCSAGEVGLSSALLTSEEHSVVLSELGAEVGGAVGAVVLGVEVADEGLGAAEALAYKTIFRKYKSLYFITCKTQWTSACSVCPR